MELLLLPLFQKPWSQLTQAGYRYKHVTDPVKKQSSMLFQNDGTMVFRRPLDFLVRLAGLG